jgi:hypothetical protein
MRSVGEGHVNGSEKRPSAPRVKGLESPHGVWEPQTVFVSMVAVLMVGPTAVELAGFVEMAGESPTRGDGPGIVLLWLPFLFRGSGRWAARLAGPS